MPHTAKTDLPFAAKKLGLRGRFPRLLACLVVLIGAVAAHPAIDSEHVSDDWQFTINPYMWGLAAIAGHLLTSTVVGGTVSAAGEASFETVEADARNLAKKVSKELGQFFVRQGWTPASAVK